MQPLVSSGENQPSVNYRDLEIAKYLASVALKPQTAKPPAPGGCLCPPKRCRATPWTHGTAGFVDPAVNVQAGRGVRHVCNCEPIEWYAATSAEKTRLGFKLGNG
jgi:hypothetical protein